MWWIYKKDQASYERLMHSEGQDPTILQEKDDKVQVIFTASALNTWMMMGNHIE